MQPAQQIATPLAQPTNTVYNVPTILVIAFEFNWFGLQLHD